MKGLANIDRPESPSSSFSQINTTIESNRNSLLFSPESSGNRYEGTASTERKSSSIRESHDRREDRRRKTASKADTKKELRMDPGFDRHAHLNKSDYSPTMTSRKGGGSNPFPSSSSTTAGKNANFTFSCPGSEKLRPTTKPEDEWRSSYEGESDEEEKSNTNFNFNSIAHNNRKLRFSPRPLFGSEYANSGLNSRSSMEGQLSKNDEFYEDEHQKDEHQKMDSNMSSMALHVRDKGRMKSRTIFDNEISPAGQGGPGGSSRPYLFMRGIYIHICKCSIFYLYIDKVTY
jgi:hypothetical protein